MITQIKKNVGIMLCSLCVFSCFTGCTPTSTHSSYGLSSTALDSELTKEISSKEFPILEAYIELKDAQGFSGETVRGSFLHIAYKSDNNQILFDVIRLYDNYDKLSYSIEFYLGDKNTVLVEKVDTLRTKYVFTLTEDMYKDLFA